MRRRSSALLCVGLITATVAPLTGCGSSKSSTATGTSSATASVAAQPSAAVRQTVVAWGKASTPSAVCSLMTYGFKLGAAPKGKTPAQCTTWVAKQLGPLQATSAKITLVRTQGGQTVVGANFAGSPKVLYLVPECGTLKVNSVGKYFANPPKPPHC
jgi:hypothetical protein